MRPSHPKVVATKPVASKVALAPPDGDLVADEVDVLDAEADELTEVALPILSRSC